MRQEALENEIKREKEQHAFDEKKSSAAQLEELKTAKRRAKRQKLKVRPRARGAAPPRASSSSTTDAFDARSDGPRRRSARRRSKARARARRRRMMMTHREGPVYKVDIDSSHRYEGKQTKRAVSCTHARLAHASSSSTPPCACRIAPFRSSKAGASPR